MTARETIDRLVRDGRGCEVTRGILVATRGMNPREAFHAVALAAALLRDWAEETEGGGGCRRSGA